MDVRVRFAVDDPALSDLHSRAFGYAATSVESWTQRLQRHSLTWIGAFDRGSLVGFVHACWDGGSHAFVLDTAVDPDHQRRGIGGALVQAAERGVGQQTKPALGRPDTSQGRRSAAPIPSTAVTSDGLPRFPRHRAGRFAALSQAVP